MEIREARKFGIAVEIKRIDFAALMEHMREKVDAGSSRIRKALVAAKDFDFYSGEAEFIGDYTLSVGGKTIRGKTIFLVSGARPLVPRIAGIESIEYLTNESVLRLRQRPESMAIIGGGYIASEFAHFFEAMGTQVTIIQRNKRLVPEEEPEVSELLRESLARRMTVHTATEAVEVQQHGKLITVTARNSETGTQTEINAERVLIAAGRKSNADILMVEKTGVRMNEKGYIVVDEYFETTRKNIWSFGDAIGKKMFRHTANRESEMVWHNAVHGKKSRMNYLTEPHAVFSWPEIASVGLTEKQAIKIIGRENILTGTAKFSDTARGEAMMENEAFAKAIVHRKTGKILGYHIIGPHASILIQEVVNAMANDGTLWSVAKGQHIHPALPEVVLKAFARLAEPR